MWILTEEYNDYDQYGEYFLDAWLEKPTADDLKYLHLSEDEIEHILLGGGRRYSEDQWYHLRQHK